MVHKEEALMKKKQLVTIIIMIVLVALLVVGYIFAKGMNEKKQNNESEEEAEQTQVIDIYDINVDDVIGISITNDMGTFDMVNVEGLWQQKDTEIPLVTEDVTYMLQNISNFDAIRVIDESADDLAQYALDKPSLQYKITMKDDTVYEIKFGQKLQTQVEAYYALIGSDNKVYSLAANYYDPFYVALEDMTAIEDEILINTENITKFAVNTTDGLNFAASYVGDDFEGSSYYKWKIDEPYENVLVDTDSLNAIIESLSGLSYKSCVSYDCQDMAQYGLEKPFATIGVEYYDVIGEEDNSETEETSDGDETQESEETSEDEETEPTPVPENMRSYATFELNIGSKYAGDDSDGYYVNPEGSNNVYKVSATAVDTLVGFDAFSLADPCIYTILVDQLSGYEIEYEGEKIVVERKTKDDTDVYYVNGTEVETEDLLRLYSAAYLLTYTGEVDDEKATPEKEPVLTLTYHTNSGKTDVVKYIPYDGNNFYQVDNNGVNYFLTDKRGIDDLIRRYKEYMENNF